MTYRLKVLSKTTSVKSKKNEMIVQMTPVDHNTQRGSSWSCFSTSDWLIETMIALVKIAVIVLPRRLTTSERSRSNA